MNDVPAPEALWEALTAVVDPELGLDVVTLGLVYDVTVSASGFARVLMTLTSPGCPAADLIDLRVRLVLAVLPGVSGVEVVFTFRPPWTPDRISDDGRDLLRASGLLP